MAGEDQALQRTRTSGAIVATPTLPMAGFGKRLTYPSESVVDAVYTAQWAVLRRAASAWAGQVSWMAQRLHDIRQLQAFAADLSGSENLFRLTLPPDMYGPRGAGTPPRAAAALASPAAITHSADGYAVLDHALGGYAPVPGDHVNINGRLYQIMLVATAGADRELKMLPNVAPPQLGGNVLRAEFAEPYVIARAIDTAPLLCATDGYRNEPVMLEWREDPNADAQGVPVVTFYILTEGGDRITAENGDRLIFG